VVQGAASSVPEAVGSDSPGSRCAAPGGVRSCSVGCEGTPRSPPQGSGSGCCCRAGGSRGGFASPWGLGAVSGVRSEGLP